MIPGRKYIYLLYPFLAAVSCILFSFACPAQNLVPNPSFEQFTACPDTFPKTCCTISDARYWYAAGFSPDYLNACDTNTANPYYGVPVNQYGHQLARTGVAYAGIITSWLYPPKDSVREYIETKLIDSLRAGNKYIVSFYVSLGDSSYYSANDIGVFFSDTLIPSTSNYPLPFSPQIKNNPWNNPLTNKMQWTEVKDTIIAKGREQYIIIGNFKNDANTDTTNLFNSTPPANGLPWAYYYIDDVTVFYDSTNQIERFSSQGNINIFPNPSDGCFKIKANNIFIKKIEIVSLLGDVIYLQVNPSPGNYYTINLPNRESGVYLLKVNEKIYSKIIIY